MKQTVGVISLGCAKNQVDTEYMLGLLDQAGFGIVTDPAQADILIVNTCGFIDIAKQESIDTTLELAEFKTYGRCKKLVMTGCLSQRYGAQLHKAMSEVDIFLGVRDYEKLPELLGAPAPKCEIPPRILTTPPWSAYLRIADGCGNRCAYCAIPLIRGPLHSVPMEELIAEAKRLADRGVTELTVIAQDTSDYGVDLYGKPRLAELLRELAKIDGLHWIRTLYTYPDSVTEQLLDVIAEEPKLVPYLDMPLQHSEEKILTRMNRRGSRKHIQRVLDYARKNMPDLVLRTTMMVGFPGETEADFENMLAFLRDNPFDRVGAFAFSPEEGTPAAEMPGQLPDEVKDERLRKLMEQQQKISFARNQQRVGKVEEVLVEFNEPGSVRGRSYAETPEADGYILLHDAKDCKPGEYVKVRYERAMEYDMVGEVIHESAK